MFRKPTGETVFTVALVGDDRRWRVRADWVGRVSTGNKWSDSRLLLLFERGVFASNICMISVVCLMFMKHPPRLVMGNCPDCPSVEIVVKEIDLAGKSYKGYCLYCGVDVIGFLVSRTISGPVLKDERSDPGR